MSTSARVSNVTSIQGYKTAETTMGSRFPLHFLQAILHGSDSKGGKEA